MQLLEPLNGILFTTSSGQTPKRRRADRFTWRCALAYALIAGFTLFGLVTFIGLFCLRFVL